MSKQIYVALVTIGSPGSPDFKAGDRLDLDEENAERLLRVGAVELADGVSTVYADADIHELRRKELEEVARAEGVEGIDDKNMSVLIEEIEQIRAARDEE